MKFGKTLAKMNEVDLIIWKRKQRKISFQNFTVRVLTINLNTIIHVAIFKKKLYTTCSLLENMNQYQLLFQFLMRNIYLPTVFEVIFLSGTIFFSKLNLHNKF